MKTLRLLVAFAALLLSATNASAHCQVPCGIYGDETKFAELEQHVETIAKAASQIRELGGGMEKPDPQTIQQLVRWTDNKESHAARIIDEAANYFLAQRIKSDQAKYAEKLELLHEIIVLSMKSKQSSGAEAPEMLGKKIAEFKKLYFAK